MQKSHLFRRYFYSILSAVIYVRMPLMAKHIYADPAWPIVHKMLGK